MKSKKIKQLKSKAPAITNDAINKVLNASDTTNRGSWFYLRLIVNTQDNIVLKTLLLLILALFHSINYVLMV